MNPGLRHLAKDPIIKTVVEKFGLIDYPPKPNTFAAIASSIIGQQLSGKAADTIWSRFLTLFPDQTVTPEVLISLDSEAIRGIGASYAKAKYLKDLAEKTLNSTLELEKLTTMSDDEVIDHLIQVKGIGRWTAEMLLMFTLSRPDVLPLDDLGIQNAFVKLYGLNKSHKSFKVKMQKIAEPWRPYRTLACWYLWKFLDNR